MKGLNLSNFQKLKADANTTTLKHPMGHKIIIAHESLSDKMKKELHSLPFAEGGEVPGGKGSPAIDPSKVGGDVTTSGDPIVKAASDAYTKFFGQPKAEGGYVDTVDSGDPIYQKLKKKPESDTHEGEGYSSTPNSRPTPANAKDEAYKKQVRDFNAQMAPGYADGGSVQDSEASILNDIADQPPQQQPTEAQFAQDHPILDRFGLNGKMFGGPGDQSDSNLSTVPTSGGMGMSPTQAVSPGPDGTQPVLPALASQQAPEASPQPDQGPANPPAPQAVSSGVSSGVPSGMQAGLQMQMQGLQNQYKAEKQAGEAKAKVEEQAIAQQQQQAQSYDNRMAVLQQERQNILKDKIDPNHLWNSKSTTDKVGTILGLLVGGFNPKGNDSVRQLDEAIGRDIDAQKTNKSNALNSLTQMFGDANTAAQYHRVILNDQVSHGIDLAMAHAATPQALANLQQAKGKLMFDSGIRMAGIGAQVTLNSPNPNPGEIDKSLNTLRMLDPAKAKEFESRVIPGVGVGSVPIDNKTREAFTAGQTFMQQMDQLEHFRQAHKGALFGASADEGHRLAELARNSFRIAQGEGVFKAGSQHFNEKLIPDPTDIDIFNKNRNAYADMKTQAQRELQNSMTTNGIKPFANSPIKPQGSPSGFQPKSFKPIK